MWAARLISSDIVPRSNDWKCSIIKNWLPPRRFMYRESKINQEKLLLWHCFASNEQSYHWIKNEKIRRLDSIRNEDTNYESRFSAPFFRAIIARQVSSLSPLNRILVVSPAVSSVLLAERTNNPYIRCSTMCTCALLMSVALRVDFGIRANRTLEPRGNL